MEKYDQPKISVNQLGYRPGDRKIAVLPAGAGPFSVVDAAAGTVVWSGDVSEPIWDEAAGAMFRQGDFSAFTSPGVYRLAAKDEEVSLPFVIADERYRELHKALLKAFYYFRCGMERTIGGAAIWTYCTMP